jgi:hypothetical protein
MSRLSEQISLYNGIGIRSDFGYLYQVGLWERKEKIELCRSAFIMHGFSNLLTKTFNIIPDRLN